MNGEKVLVTGCNGFIGSHLTLQLINAGYQVVGLDILPLTEAQNVQSLNTNGHFDYIVGDVTDKALVDSVIDASFSKVFHLAARVGIERYMENPIDVVRTNVVGTLNVLEAAIRHNCYLFFSSTSEVYGKNPNVPWAEDDDRVLGSTSFERWSYSSSKSAAEHAVRGAFKQQNLKGCIVRFFNIYGPGQSEAFVVSRNILLAAKGHPLVMHNTGSQTRCFTFIDDAVAACIKLVQDANTNGEVYNVGNNTEHTVLQVLNTIIEISGKPLTIETIQTSDNFGDAFEDIMRRVPLTSKIYKAIGWEATTSLHEGLSKTYQWAINQKG
jgi:UDP-glucose 4-epimerase